jgi:hypothetical protein
VIHKTQAVDPIPEMLSLEGYAYAKAGDRDKAQAVLGKLDQVTKGLGYVSPYFVARIHAALGDKDRR